MKRILSLILSICLLCALFVTPAFAGDTYNSDVTLSASLDKSELTVSSSAQTVVLTVSTSKAVDLFSIGYSVAIPEGWSINSINSGSSSINYSGYSSTTTGVVSWFDPMAENKSASTIGVISVSVPANTPAGNYSIGVSGVELATEGQNSDNAWMSNGTASAQLTIKAPAALTGTATITGTAKFGQTLTASLTGGNNTGTLSYKWYRGDTVISGATGKTYTLVAADIGEAIKVEISSSVQTGSVTSSATSTVGKADGPKAPSCTFSFDGENAGKLMGSTTAMEYSLDGGETWTACTANVALTGENITADKDIKVRVKETATTNAGAEKTIDITKAATPTGVGKTDCTTTANNDGTLTNVTSDMEYQKSGASSWTAINGTTVTGLADGTYLVRVKANGTKLASDAQEVTITAFNPVSVIGVSLNKSSTTIEVGSSETLTATVAPANATNKNVTWSSSNTSVATVNANGKVTGVAEGTAMITVTTADGSKTATCTVTVEKGSDRVLTSRNAVSFTDVAQGAYYYDAVKWAVKNGVTEGKTANRFDPNGPVTRAQAVTFLWRAAGCPKVNYFMKFTDLKAGAYYTEAVRWAVAMGITKGVDETHFNPDATCTRAQIVSFLYRYAKASSVSAANPFTDVKAGAYYYDAVLWAVKNGITSGKTATTFAPAETCNRAQVVTFLYRYMAK